jgi:hypothetical protein
MTNLEKWAYAGFAGGGGLGALICKSDANWMRKISMLYAIQCTFVYAAMRVAGGLDAPE